MIMKKLVSMTMAMAMMAALFVACGDDGTDDETPPPAVPTIALDGGDIDQPQEITNPMSVKIGVTAPGAIAGFTVTIDSPALTAEMLATVGLATELNLVNPGSMAEALGALGFPSGEAVSGKTALTFDISKLVPMIAQIYNETSDHKFILKVTDAKGKSTTKTLTCHLTGKVALAYNNDADLWANTATVTAANVPDGGSVQYRVKGAADWTDAVLVEGSKYRLAPVYETSKNAAGLDVHTIKAGTGVFAATTYEVRIAKDGQAVDSKEFATAVGDKIPNGDMSGWSKKQMTTDGKTFWPITYPNAEGNSVWDSGNNMFLEQYNDDGTPTIFTPLCRQDETEPGTARLQARMVLDFVFAPGNMFTGDFNYSGFSGTVNFGKPYAWTARPRALKVRYKAQIGKIDKVGSYDPDGASYQDKQDCARIFVAVVNWKAQHGVTSGMTEPAGMWDPAVKTSLDEGAILGYGDLVITQTATGWVEATLPFNWYAKDAANPASAPFSLVISCATSVRGDLPDGLFDQYDASRRFRVGLLIGNHVPGPKPAGSGTVSRQGIRTGFFLSLSCSRKNATAALSKGGRRGVG